MKPTPPGWPRISSSLYYNDAETAIDWLCNAFGFMVRIKIAAKDGSIAHSELEFGEGLIMVGEAGKGAGSDQSDEGNKADDGDRSAAGRDAERGKDDGGETAWQRWQASPADCGQRNTQSLCLYVDDVDAHCARARAAGADIFREPATTDYGEKYWTDRGYGAKDPEGHIWWFMQRLRTTKAAAGRVPSGSA